MTGGGNDVLGNSCTGTCASVVDAVAARLAQLRMVMAMDGVEDVIMVSYGYPTAAARKPALDYSRNCSHNSARRPTNPAAISSTP